MTDITLEQRARDIVVQSLISHGYERGAAERMVAGGHLAFEGEDVFAMIKAALRLSAGADGWMLELYRDRDGELGVWAKQEGGSRVWIARAAAPRHEPGEG